MISHFQSPQTAQQWCNAQRHHDKTIGFVATMGALHAGHVSLVKRAQMENQRVIVSIFINPLQFNRPEDLKQYPKDDARDIALLESLQVDAVFTGSAADVLGEAADKNPQDLDDPGPYAQGLEGRYRPGHFAGVQAVVSRLFQFVGPCRAYFGEKDYQQLQIIKQLAEKFPGIEVVPCPTSREPSGLARSSRNLRLSKQGIERAASLFETMCAANQRWQQGARSPGELQQAMLEALRPEEIELEYAEVRDPLHWTSDQPEQDLTQARAFIAANIEGVRLIDNMALGITPAQMDFSSQSSTHA